MNIQEKKLIEAFLNKDDARHHDRAVELLFYGRKSVDARGREIHTEFDVTRSIRNAVSIYYSGALYNGRHREVYDTFVSLFHDHLMKMSLDSFLKVDDLQKWMFKVAKNFANGYRKEIHKILGIEDNVVPFVKKQDVTEKPDTGLEERNVVNGDTHVRKVPDYDDEFSSDSEDSSKWAEDLIKEYISRISHDYYREVLYAIDIYGMEMVDFAEEQGKKRSSIHLDHKRAKAALIQAALPDIRWRMPKLFDSFKDFLDSEEIVLLECFFDRGEVKDMKDLIEAYVKLLKVSRRETKKTQES